MSSASVFSDLISPTRTCPSATDSVSPVSPPTSITETSGTITSVGFYVYYNSLFPHIRADTHLIFAFRTFLNLEGLCFYCFIMFVSKASPTTGSGGSSAGTTAIATVGIAVLITILGPLQPLLLRALPC